MILQEGGMIRDEENQDSGRGLGADGRAESTNGGGGQATYTNLR